MKLCTYFSVVLATFAASSYATADVFYLSNGGRIEGDLLNPEESPRTSYVLQTPEGAKLKLGSSQVERVVMKSAAEKSYEVFLAKLPDTKEAHWDAASRCEKAGLKDQREYHLEQVLRLDPNHEDARHALGYSRVAGAWARPDDVMRQKGYVRRGNAWRLPQEVELNKAAESADEKVAEWRKNIRRWREWVIKGRERANEGQQEILHVRDPMAATALVELLMKDKEPPALRLLYIDPLAAIGGNEALAAFVRIVLEDRDAKVREKCLDEIVKSNSKAAARAFIRGLKNDDNVIVNRAARALERMNDPEATLPLVDALITEHKATVGSSGMTPSFSSDGGAGMSMGGGPKVVKYKMKNDPVMRALLTLHPGVSAGYDQQAWRAWWLEQNRPKTIVSLRRDP